MGDLVQLRDDAGAEESAKPKRLSRMFDRVEQVQSLPMDELRRLRAEHDAELVQVRGSLDAHPDAPWAYGARRSIAPLTLHQEWIIREIKSREKADRYARQRDDKMAAAEAKRQRKVELKESEDRKLAAQTARMSIRNAEEIRDIEVFKEVAREVLGGEMYQYLWEATNAKLQQTRS